VFPHHENEIAQSEGAFDCPFARYWIHNGFVKIDQEKMSKSLGNVFAIEDALARFDAAPVRHYILSSHYRSPIDFSEQGLEEAGKGVDRIYETLDRLNETLSPRGSDEPEEKLLNEFRLEMDDDFNTTRAIALIFEEIRSLNRMLNEGKTNELRPRRAALSAMGSVLGLLQEKPTVFLNRRKERWLRMRGLSSEAIENLIQRREKARGEKKWQEADRIRDELNEKGIALEDSPRGTVWKVQ
jgi:cysteinyl-tRNA synthetase